MEQLDAYLGSGGSLFLQGAGGDTKPAVIGKDVETWRRGNWEDVERAGTIVAGEVIQALEAGLVQIESEIRAHLIDMSFPLVPCLSRSGFEELLENPEIDELECLWAERQIVRLDRDQKLPVSVPISCHGVQLGKGLRLVGLEGESVAELGLLIRNFYSEGVTFILGYTDGAQLYLPTSEMLEQGGYEVESYFEYGHPAPLASGLEKILIRTLQQMQAWGIG